MIKNTSKDLRVESVQEQNGTITIKIQNTSSQASPSNPAQDSLPEFDIDKVSQEKTAQMFDVTVQTIINWRKRGWIKGYKIGHPVFYRKSELLQAASSNPLLQKA